MVIAGTREDTDVTHFKLGGVSEFGVGTGKNYDD